MGSTIETLQDTSSQINDDQTDKCGGKNNGGNKPGRGNNNSGGNKNGGNNAYNDNGGVNNSSNSGKFGSSARRRGEFTYITTARVATTKVHDMHHVPNTTKSDTMARIEPESNLDTICAGKNMTPLSYTVYECNVVGFHSDLNQWRRSH